MSSGRLTAAIWPVMVRSAPTTGHCQRATAPAEKHQHRPGYFLRLQSKHQIILNQIAAPDVDQQRIPLSDSNAWR